jgi:light-harvesting complex II chlorophyll a/b binding protein 5
MAAMAAAKADFMGQSVVASKSDVVAQKQGGLRVVSIFGKGKQAAAKATKQVKKAAPKAAPKIASAARKAVSKVNRSDNEELAKWYGPDRRIYLPEGLLAKDEIPPYLTGEVPGDYGYDPFGLSKKPEDFDKYQAYELIHARWAMLGAAGFVLPEAFNKFGAVCGPEAVWWKTGALLLEGDSIQYFGATIPVNLAAAVIAR